MSGLRLAIPAAVACLVALSSLSSAQTAGNDKPSRKIVVFAAEVTDQTTHAQIVGKKGAHLVRHLGLVNAAAINATPVVAAALAADPQVSRVDDDPVMALAKSARTPQPAQTICWGVDRINAPAAWPVAIGAKVKVAIIDTGIDLDHPDLRTHIKGGVNIVAPGTAPGDDNGHGTHCAGVIGALNNSIGVVGVAPGVQIYAVKAFYPEGYAYYSDIIAGIEWCITKHMQVISMSFGGGEYDLLHEALVKAHDAGIVLVAAAGNQGSYNSVLWPARYPETIAVSAMAQGNWLASFSSYGPEVDVIAPGLYVLSCYNDGYYASMSGTSMATPHVAGVAALILATKVGAYDADGDGAWDPAEVMAKLQATAEDIGLTPDQQGAGLVRPDLAVQ